MDKMKFMIQHIYNTLNISMSHFIFLSFVFLYTSNRSDFGLCLTKFLKPTNLLSSFSSDLPSDDIIDVLLWINAYKNEGLKRFYMMISIRTII